MTQQQTLPGLVLRRRPSLNYCPKGHCPKGHYPLANVGAKSMYLGAHIFTEALAC